MSSTTRVQMNIETLEFSKGHVKGGNILDSYHDVGSHKINEFA